MRPHARNWVRDKARRNGRNVTPCWCEDAYEESQSTPRNCKRGYLKVHPRPDSECHNINLCFLLTVQSYAVYTCSRGYFLAVTDICTPLFCLNDFVITGDSTNTASIFI